MIWPIIAFIALAPVVITPASVATDNFDELCTYLGGKSVPGPLPYCAGKPDWAVFYKDVADYVVPDSVVEAIRE